jgi:isopentenyl diphosphate isomerase/L-lactate dehydrogenase-like FMN-dependent dehydrogenase
VSNHGGLHEYTGRSTIEALPEVVAGVGRRAPVIVDGGFRRGSDIFKALALGATAVGIGRPYLWGLAAFEQAGVEAALDILDNELRTFMVQVGVASSERLGQPGVNGYVIGRQ